MIRGFQKSPGAASVVGVVAGTLCSLCVLADGNGLEEVVRADLRPVGT